MKIKSIQYNNSGSTSTIHIGPSSCAEKFPKVIINNTQTELFSQSVEYALKAVKGDTVPYTEGLNEDSIHVIYSIKNMSEDIRSDIYKSIQLLANKPGIEEQIRQISYTQNTPIWILLVKQSIISVAS